MARRRNQIPNTSETNLYFANNMLIAFCVQPPAIFLHSAGKFPSCFQSLSLLDRGSQARRTRLREGIRHHILQIDFLVNNLKKKGNTLHGYITGKNLKKPRKEIKPTVQRSVTIGARTRHMW